MVGSFKLNFKLNSRILSYQLFYSPSSTLTISALSVSWSLKLYTRRPEEALKNTGAQFGELMFEVSTF